MILYYRLNYQAGFDQNISNNTFFCKDGSIMQVSDIKTKTNKNGKRIKERKIINTYCLVVIISESCLFLTLWKNLKQFVKIIKYYGIKLKISILTMFSHVDFWQRNTEVQILMFIITTNLYCHST